MKISQTAPLMDLLFDIINNEKEMVANHLGCEDMFMKLFSNQDTLTIELDNADDDSATVDKGIKYTLKATAEKWEDERLTGAPGSADYGSETVEIK